MKRFARNVFLFLLLGAIINIAVAWAGALEWSDSRWGLNREDGGALLAPSNEWLLFVRTDGMLFVQVTWSAMPATRGTNELFMPRLRKPPWWSAISSLPGYQRPNVEGHRLNLSHAEVGFGFPLLSMLWAGRMTQQKPAVFTSVVRLPDRRIPASGMETAFPRFLPLHIIWAGFVVDTIVYAVTAWVMFVMPWALLHRIRSRGGRCTQCGYDLRQRRADSMVCPECGRGSPDQSKPFPWRRAIGSSFAALVLLFSAVLARAWPVSGQRMPPSWSMTASSLPTHGGGTSRSASGSTTAPSIVLFTDDHIESMTLEDAQAALKQLADAIKAPENQTATKRARLSHEVTAVLTRLRALRDPNPGASNPS